MHHCFRESFYNNRDSFLERGFIYDSDLDIDFDSDLVKIFEIQQNKSPSFVN